MNDFMINVNNIYAVENAPLKYYGFKMRLCFFHSSAREAKAAF